MGRSEWLSSRPGEIRSSVACENSRRESYREKKQQNQPAICVSQEQANEEGQNFGWWGRGSGAKSKLGRLEKNRRPAEREEDITENRINP